MPIELIAAWRVMCFHKVLAVEFGRASQGALMTETTRLLRDLVALPSVNPMGRDLQGPEIYEGRVTAYLEDFFRSLGVPYERQHVAPLRDNILARFEQPGARRTVVLEVHQDTVPADTMTIEPFAAHIEEGRLYGRGACDVKGGMAAMLAAFARLVREKPAGAMNVILACAVDEEHTFLGVQELVRRGLKADMAVVAEPTQLEIVRAHKGVVRWHVTTLGKSCHSSAPRKELTPSTTWLGCWSSSSSSPSCCGLRERIRSWARRPSVSAESREAPVSTPCRTAAVLKSIAG
jgi:acetylornithine deacetylase/succinyl-diaminopimelate desuccinylase-like protein